MRITFAFTIHQVLAGAAHSSSDMCLPPSEVRDHLTLTYPHPQIRYDSKTNENRKGDAGLTGKTIHIRLAGIDAPEVSD